MLASNQDDVCMAPEADAPRWIPVKLAYVTYPKDDFAGHLLAWFSLAPLLLIFSTLSLLLFRREIQIFVFLIGMFVNEMINLVRTATVVELNFVVYVSFLLSMTENKFFTEIRKKVEVYSTVNKNIRKQFVSQ